MNAIFHANMQAILAVSATPNELNKVVRLNENSVSRKAIEYLFEHGKVSGTELMLALGVKNSPQSYMFKHIQAGRVICELVKKDRVNYSINPLLSRANFGLENDA